jgi:hypothetical protein
MARSSDVEAPAFTEEPSNAYDSHTPETEALLPTSRPEVEAAHAPAKGSKLDGLFNTQCTRTKFSTLHVSTAFILGACACLLAQFAICGTNCFKRYDQRASAAHAQDDVSVLAPPWSGSTDVHHFPPSKPTNAFPSLFPSNVGYAGGTPTGAEAAIVATAPAYPLHTGQCSHELIRPASLPGDDSPLNDKTKNLQGKKDSKFNLFRSWGNLSPWYSVPRGRFGLESSAETPDTCRITGLHFLHRHGARYPTAWGKSFMDSFFSCVKY